MKTAVVTVITHCDRKYIFSKYFYTMLQEVLKIQSHSLCNKTVTRQKKHNSNSVITLYCNFKYDKEF